LLRIRSWGGYAIRIIIELDAFVTLIFDLHHPEAVLNG
jgi:hypothetical protein